MENIELGQKITRLRKEQNMTQKELADKLHVSDKTVSKWENGNSEPNLQVLKDLADALGTTISKLLGEEEKPKKNINERMFNFFKNNYLLIIEFVLTFIAFIFFTVTFGVYVNRKDDWHSKGAMIALLVATIVLTLLQFFFIFVKGKNVYLLALKIFTTFLPFALGLFILISFGCVNHADKPTIALNVVTAIGYFLLCFSSAISICVDWGKGEHRILNFGKIVMGLTMAFACCQIGIFVADSVLFGYALSNQKRFEALPQFVGIFLNKEPTGTRVFVDGYNTVFLTYDVYVGEPLFIKTVGFNEKGIVDYDAKFSHDNEIKNVYKDVYVFNNYSNDTKFSYPYDLDYYHIETFRDHSYYYRSRTRLNIYPFILSESVNNYDGPVYTHTFTFDENHPTSNIITENLRFEFSDSTNSIIRWSVEGNKIIVTTREKITFYKFDIFYTTSNINCLLYAY